MIINLVLFSYRISTSLFTTHWASIWTPLMPTITSSNLKLGEKEEVNGRRFRRYEGVEELSLSPYFSDFRLPRFPHFTAIIAPGSQTKKICMASQYKSKLIWVSSLCHKLPVI